MTWAIKRQLFYLGVLLVFFLVLGFLIGYPYFNRPPTCDDGRQNGDETGVDCGGACILACLSQVDDISILWSRAFPVVPGRHNAVAYIENHNKNSAIHRIKYRFRFADENNFYIGKREGETFIPPAGKFAIFEPAIDFGNSNPVYTTFEFIETPIWGQIPLDVVNQLRVVVSDIKLENETTSPRLSAKLKNNSLFSIPEIIVITILYDDRGNALSTSSTFVDRLDGGESREVNFTWPQPIPGVVVAKEVIPMYNLFLVKLK